MPLKFHSLVNNEQKINCNALKLESSFKSNQVATQRKVDAIVILHRKVFITYVKNTLCADQICTVTTNYMQSIFKI